MLSECIFFDMDIRSTLLLSEPFDFYEELAEYVCYRHYFNDEVRDDCSEEIGERL